MTEKKASAIYGKVVVLIPIAGKGTRLRPLTLHRPKALLLVAGKPVICHIIERLQPLKPSLFVIVRDPQQKAVESYLKSHFPDLSFRFAVQQEPRGLGHAVSLGLEKLDKQPTLILLGDTVFKAPLKSIIRKSICAIGVRKVEDPARFGTVTIERNRITALVEKSPHPLSNNAIVGIYWIPDPGKLKSALSQILKEGKTTKGEFQLTDALQRMVQKEEEIIPFRVNGWYDCGTVNALLDSQPALMKHRIRGTVKNSTIIPPVWVEKDSLVQESIIGPHVTVAQHVVIQKSHIEESILHENSEIYNAMLSRSIIGAKAHVAGARGRLLLGDYAQIYA